MTQANSNEFKLVAACCRWPPSHSKAIEVAKWSSCSLDWDQFLLLVRRQRVEGLVHSALDAAAVGVPERIKLALAQSARSIGAQNLLYVQESARLQRLLDAAGIRFLFVKGVILAVSAYGSLGIKKAWDIDLLVEPTQTLEASKVLVAAGYVRSMPGPEVTDEQFGSWGAIAKESLWIHQSSGTVVELHSSLVDNPRMMPSVSAASPREMVHMGAGISLPTLPKDELFAYLCLHGAWHGWSRLKWLADVNAFLSTESKEEVVRLYRRSIELGCGRSSAQALLLCSQLFGLELPDSLARELRSDRYTVWLTRIALHVMTGRGATELDDTVFGTVAINLAHFLIGRGVPYKLSELGRKLQNPEDQLEMPLPRQLRFLYPIAALPRWVLRRARRGRPGSAARG